LATVGAREQDAAIVATNLIDSDLRGIDTHGIVRLPGYVERIRAGGILTSAELTVVEDSGSIITLDAHGGFGQVAATRGMQLAVERARENGIAAAAVRDSNHVGALGFYSRMAVEDDSIGIAVSGGSAFIAPWGGTQALLSTNPWSMAFPADRNVPLVVDVSNAVALSGAVAAAADRGEQIPLGWALDADGSQTTDARAVASLMPFGGPKGAALTLALEVLASGLTGATYAKDVPVYEEYDEPQRLGHLFVALRIQRFLPFGQFTRRLDELIDALHASPAASGHAEVLIPGERGAKNYTERSLSGIPIRPTLAAQLIGLAAELGIPGPVPVRAN
jgi:LDH2 family malate/lactate/ureidoglycolate dehydrogenase